MPIESLQAPVPATPGPTDTGSATTQSGLPAGTLEGRVTAVLDNGTVRFTTAFGPVDLATDQPLPLGTRAQLLVENSGIRILLTQLAASDARTAAASAPGSSLLAASAEAAAATTETNDPAFAQRSATLAALGATARAATATQQSPAALLSRLLPLLSQESGGLPPQVQRAAAALAALPVRADDPLDPAVLQAAMRQSGVFREARLAAGTLRGGDWKQALLGLREALQAWTPPDATPASGEAEPDAPAASPPARDIAAQAQPRVSQIQPDTLAVMANLLGPQEAPEGNAAQKAGVQQAATQRPAGEGAGSARPGQPTVQAGVSEADLIASMADEGAAWRRAATPQLLGALLAKAFGAAQPDAPQALQADATGSHAATDEQGHASADGRPAPPRADQSPRTVEARQNDPSLVGASARDQREALLALTEGALDRVRLSQFASLPREAMPGQQPLQPGQPQAPAWVFDVPFLLGRETGVAQFRVTRDGRGNAATPAARPAWSVDVAIDTAETGPVHARIRLGGDGLGVTLWAERHDTAETLRREMPALRRSLDDAAFEVEDVAILTGSPSSAPARSSGYFLDRRS